MCNTMEQSIQMSRRCLLASIHVSSIFFIYGSPLNDISFLAVLLKKKWGWKKKAVEIMLVKKAAKENVFSLFFFLRFLFSTNL